MPPSTTMLAPLMYGRVVGEEEPDHGCNVLGLGQPAQRRVLEQALLRPG